MGVSRSLPVTQDPLIPPVSEHRTVPEPSPWTFLCPPGCCPLLLGTTPGDSSRTGGAGATSQHIGVLRRWRGGLRSSLAAPYPPSAMGSAQPWWWGTGWGSAPGPPPVPPVEAPSPVRSQGSVTSAPFQQLHRSPSEGSEGAAAPEVSPPQPQVPQEGSDQCKNSAEFIASAAAPACPDPRGLPPAAGQREEQGLEGAENYRGGGHRGGKRGAGAAVGTWGRQGTWLAPSCYRGRGRRAALRGSRTRCREEEEDEELLGQGEGGAPALLSL